MKISTLGSHEHTRWFARRLSEQGWSVREGSPPAGLSVALPRQDYAGLLLGKLLIDTDNSGLITRQQLAATCLQHGLGYAELAGHWVSLGVQFGFPLFVGCSLQNRLQLQPLLDQLAPQAGAWLYCGPPGAACYASRVFDALAQVGALIYQAGWSQPGSTPVAPDWEAFFAQQSMLAERLLQLSVLYLSLHPEQADLDLQQSLSAFSQPPTLQSHFSANLARLLVLALSPIGQRAADTPSPLQQVFSQLVPQSSIA